MVICDVCGDNLGNNGGAIIAESLQVKLEDAIHPEVKKVLDYYGRQNIFNVCFLCKLKSLGIKPVKETV